eukprot:365300-Chlamydomonas_euryale.AAC.4
MQGCAGPDTGSSHQQSLQVQGGPTQAQPAGAGWTDMGTACMCRVDCQGPSRQVHGGTWSAKAHGPGLAASWRGSRGLSF